MSAKLHLKMMAIVLASGVLTAPAANATLIDRGNGMIYDDANNLTWLADINYAKTSGFDADGRMNWFDAVAWASGVSYGGFDDWRLPSTSPINGGPDYNPHWGHAGLSDNGYNIGAPGTAHAGSAQSELMNIFFQIGGVSWIRPDNSQQPKGTYGLVNGTAPFIGDLTPDGFNHYSFWSESFFMDGADALPFFVQMDSGVQSFHDESSPYYAWLVRDGDTLSSGNAGGSGNAVPEPSIVALMGLGLFSMAFLRRKST